MKINNKGFTLIELIATIALLAVIAVISFVSINGVVNQSRVNDCKSLVMNIKSAAKEYISDNRYNSSVVNSVVNGNFSITGEDLINGKYLNGPIINPFNNEEIIAGSIRIELKLRDDYSVDTVTVKNGRNDIKCEDGRW